MKTLTEMNIEELNDLKDHCKWELMVANMNDCIGGWREIDEARKRLSKVEEEIKSRVTVDSLNGLVSQANKLADEIREIAGRE